MKTTHAFIAVAKEDTIVILLHVGVAVFAALFLLTAFALGLAS